MSWLHQLLNSLNTDEINSLQSISFRGKEKEVFKIYLAHLNLNTPEKEEICTRLEITNTHLYKIKSVLVNKIYRHFFKEDVLMLVEFLLSRQLYNLLKTEILQIIKDIENSKFLNKEKILLELYKKAIDLPYSCYDEKLVKIVSEKYLNFKKDSNEADKNYIIFHKLFADCNRFAAAKKPEKHFSLNENNLFEFEKELIQQKHQLALYYLYRTFISFYTYYDPNPELQLVYLEKAISLKGEIKKFFSIDIGVFLELLKADTLFSNKRFAEAYKIYDSIFSKGVEKEMYGYFYHCEQFAMLAIILKYYSKAETFLNKTFIQLIAAREGIFATRGLLAFSKLFLSLGDTKKAMQKINLANEINKKSFYLPFDLQLRVLECFAFYFKKDLDFTKQLLQQNIKFLSSLGSKKSYELYFKFCSVLSSVISCKEKSIALSLANRNEIERLHTSLVNIYGNLFLKLKE
jgi:hypothetical protein